MLVKKFRDGHLLAAPPTLGIVDSNLSKYFEGLLVFDKLCDCLLSHAIAFFVDRLRDRVVIEVIL